MVDKRDNTEHECTICYEFMAQPAMTPCKHYFCIECIRGFQDREMACPMCRFKLTKDFEPKVCEKRQAEIEKAAPKEFKARKDQLTKQGKWMNEIRKVKFVMGNTVTKVTDQEYLKRVKRDSSWDWTMFVYAEEEGKRTTAKYVKSVTYTLHPTYRQPVHKIDEAPFKLSMRAYGWFDIDVKIEFVAAVKKQPVSLTWTLNFQESKTPHQKEFEISVPVSKALPKPAAK